MTIDISVLGIQVAQELERLVELNGKPEFIACDNGTEYTSFAMLNWSKPAGIPLLFIQPDKPSQNGFVEACNGRVRDQ